MFAQAVQTHMYPRQIDTLHLSPHQVHRQNLPRHKNFRFHLAPPSRNLNLPLGPVAPIDRQPQCCTVDFCGDATADHNHLPRPAAWIGNDATTAGVWKSGVVH